MGVDPEGVQGAGNGDNHKQWMYMLKLKEMVAVGGRWFMRGRWWHKAEMGNVWW